MTEQEFIDKYGLKFEDETERAAFMHVMDDLYLRYTKEQVLEMIADFYGHADDIFNDIKERFNDKAWQELMDEIIDKLK